MSGYNSSIASPKSISKGEIDRDQQQTDPPSISSRHPPQSHIQQYPRSQIDNQSSPENLQRPIQLQNVQTSEQQQQQQQQQSFTQRSWRYPMLAPPQVPPTSHASNLPYYQPIRTTLPSPQYNKEPVRRLEGYSYVTQDAPGGSGGSGSSSGSYMYYDHSSQVSPMNPNQSPVYEQQQVYYDGPRQPSYMYENSSYFSRPGYDRLQPPAHPSLLQQPDPHAPTNISGAPFSLQQPQHPPPLQQRQQQAQLQYPQHSPAQTAQAPVSYESVQYGGYYNDHWMRGGTDNSTSILNSPSNLAIPRDPTRLPSQSEHIGKRSSTSVPSRKLRNRGSVGKMKQRPKHSSPSYLLDQRLPDDNGFVNYDHQDGSIIMAAVAPSGNCRRRNRDKKRRKEGASASPSPLVDS
uniref:ARAD1D34870p n=1 Tax=Blastobotrys adeninivorans TaxID=409370 RepID=A0A060THY2_BLAAD